jgi:hemerythrin-like domain-containing protein
VKRDRRLRGLSSEHHHALVLARAVERQIDAWSTSDGARLRDRFDRQLEPHFFAEEQVLLPALRAAGRPDLCERVERDHARLRRAVTRASAGDASAARAFGAELAEHVRFEERDLFPACEALLAGEILDEVARRAPGESSPES